MNNVNPDYEKWLHIWRKCRNGIEGQEAVHKASELYLPRLSGQNNKAYESYKMRATYVNFSGRTLDAMEGMIFKKKPIIDAPPVFDTILKDVDLAGADIQTFSELLVDELLKVGRLGVLVDYPNIQTIGMTLGQLQLLGLRPYATIYKAESILDWRYERINNVNTLTYVKLQETIEVKTGEYDWELVPQLRILKLQDGIYVVCIYQQIKSDWVLVEETTPIMNNSPMNFIPFVFDGVYGVDSDITKPILLDLVNVNLSHYRSMADYEHGLHFTGLPTPVFWGARLDDDSTISLGSAEALAFDDPSGHAEFLEFTGSGLSQLREAIKDKQEMMASLGSKVLISDKRVGESADTAMIQRNAEYSVLASLAYSASSCLTKVFQLMAMWLRVNPDNVSVKLNTDYQPKGLDANRFRELTNAYLSGAISYDEYFYNLRDNEIIRGSTTIEEEQERLQNAGLNLNADSE
jgi:hypothetical protein